MSRHHHVPKYRHHKGTGQAVVTIDGKDLYLGAHGSPQSKEKYDRIIAGWLLDKGRPPTPVTPDRVSVKQIVAGYLQFAERHYRKGGEVIEAIMATIRSAFRILVLVHGNTRATEFGELQLVEVRNKMIDAPCRRCHGEKTVQRRLKRKRGGQSLADRALPKSEKVICPRCHGKGIDGWTRNFINKCIGIIRKAWRWACRQQMIPNHLWQSLMVVESLDVEDEGVRPDPDEIEPVPDDVVDQTLPHLPPIVADMVRIQRLALMRPCEIRGMKREDIDFSGQYNGERLEGVWVYNVASKFNKLAKRKKPRPVLFGPIAQAILAPYIARTPAGYLFSPRASAERWMEDNGRKLAPTHKRPPGEFYPKNTYINAITRAARRAGVQHWHANQLRHSGITEWRDLENLKTAGDAAGHQSLETTKRYAQIKLHKVAEMARKYG